MATFEISTKGKLQQVTVSLQQEGIYLEPQAINYIHGDITVDANLNSFAAVSKTYIAGDAIGKPLAFGTGNIYLTSKKIFFYKLQLIDEEILVTKNSFWAAEQSLSVDAKLNLSFKNKLTGLPSCYIMVKGTGMVILQAPGIVTCLDLEDEPFIAAGAIVARSSSIIHTKQKLARNSRMTALSIGHKLVDHYRGKGKIYFAPFKLID